MTSGPNPQYGWDFPEEIPERPRRRTLSELFQEFPSRVRLGSPKPYNSRHLKPPEHFQNSLPPVQLGTLLFSEVVPERASQSWCRGSPSTGGFPNLRVEPNLLALRLGPKLEAQSYNPKPDTSHD